jgi:hypothetical protein
MRAAGVVAIAEPASSIPPEKNKGAPTSRFFTQWAGLKVFM